LGHILCSKTKGHNGGQNFKALEKHMNLSSANNHKWNIQYRGWWKSSDSDTSKTSLL